MIQAACFCANSMEVPAASQGDDFHVVGCTRCAQPWAVWVREGALASQVAIQPGDSFERVVFRLGLYGVRALAPAWESAEARALFVSMWTARRRWEYEDPWGRRLRWLFGLPVVRLLNRPPLWLFERIWRKWFQPEHLRDREVPLTAADRARVRALTWSRA